MSIRSTWHAVADAWPQDKLRPRQFRDAIRQAADRAFAVEGTAQHQAQLRELSPVQIAKAKEAEASLRRLLANEALKANPMSDRTTKPASFPKHYARIIDAAARAERGEVFKKSRFSWFRWQ
ncbi:hypothetical protein JCM10213_001483 [Rhodosporidiobolus nylandii]